MATLIWVYDQLVAGKCDVLLSLLSLFLFSRGSVGLATGCLLSCVVLGFMDGQPAPQEVQGRNRCCLQRNVFDVPGAFLINRSVQVGWGSSAFAGSTWFSWGERSCNCWPVPGRRKLSTLIVESAHWWVLGLLQADTELCWSLLQASPKANSRDPDDICGEHRVHRSRLFVCTSTSPVSYPSRRWSHGWVCSTGLAQQHSLPAMGRSAGWKAGGLGCLFYPPLPPPPPPPQSQSNFFCRDFMFPCFLLILMVCSWAIGLEERICLGSCCVGPLLSGLWGAVLPPLNVPWILLSAVELFSHVGTIRSLSWDLKCVSKQIWTPLVIKNSFPLKTQ